MAARATRARPARKKAGSRQLPALPWRTLGSLALAVGCVAVGALTLMSLFLSGGSLSGWLRAQAWWLFGWGAPLAAAWLGGAGIWLVVRRLRPELLPAPVRVIGVAAASLGLLGLLHALLPATAALPKGGGEVGFFLAGGLADLIGPTGAAGLLLLAIVSGLLLAAEVGPVLALGALLAALVLAGRGLLAGYRRARRPRPEPLRINHGGQAQPLERTAPVIRLPSRRPRTEPSEPAPPAEPAPPPEPALPHTSAGWKLPPTTLFQIAPAVELSPGDVRERAKTIEETLASFGITARVVEVNQGPTLTQFGIEPAPGMAVNRILARSNDLALRLGVTPIRMEAPVPGKRVVGVEVPNQTITPVNVRELFESAEFGRIKSKLRLVLGRDVVGKPVCADLARMPHLLIAGATGSGKSVCINAIIASLLVQCSPDDLQFVMVDPKMVELAPFTGLPHLRMPVVTEMDKVVGAMKWVVKEMERRYAACAERRVRNISGYNAALEPGEKAMPYLVVVIDELADMMMTAADEVEKTLCRLAQLGRAAGIHLVVATQRPSVDVITGLIKANFPTRISFAVSSQVDSRTILDMSGAEKLLGRGDMLYMPQDAGKPIRQQGVYVSDTEITQLVQFWTRLGRPSYTDADLQELEALGKGEAESDQDDIYQRALDLAGQHQRLSTSMLQRRLGIGYPRAARLMDLLEERGVIGPSEDGKSREVLAGRGD